MRSNGRTNPRLPLFFALAMLAAFGCAVTFGPADYTGSGADASVDAAPAEDVVSDEPATLPDGAPVTPARHVLVLAGEKDGAETSTNDVWVAPLTPSGDVGKFEFLQPGLFRGALVTANVAAGRLFVASRANGRSVEHAAIDAGLLASPWEGAKVDAPMFPGYGQIFSGSSLLALGGAGTVTEDDGGSTFVRDDAIRILPFDAGAFGPLAASPTKLPVPIRDMAMVA